MKCTMWALAALLLLPASALYAQDTTETGIGAPPATEKEKLFTLDLRDSPVRNALMQLFASSGEQFTMDERITGTVTLKIKDKRFDEALRLVLTTGTTPLTYVKEGGVYRILPRPQTNNPRPEQLSQPIVIEVKDASLPGTLQKLFDSANKQYTIAPEVKGTVTAQLKGESLPVLLTELLRASGQKLTWRVTNDVYIVEGIRGGGGSGPRVVPSGLSGDSRAFVIPIRNMPAAELLRQLETIRPDAIDNILVQSGTNALLAFSSDSSAMDILRERVQLLDVAGEAVTLKAEVVRTDDKNVKTVLFSSTVQARSGVLAMVTEKAMGETSVPPAISNIRILLTPTMLGEQFEVASNWELSLPMTGTKGEVVRLEKGLTATTRLLPGVPVLVGETKRNQNGIKDQLKLILTWEAAASTRVDL